MVTKILFLILTILTYVIAKKVNQKIPGLLFSPVIITPVVLIGFLLISNIPYQTYADSALPLNYMLDIVTVALAVPLYRNWEFIKTNWRVILTSLAAGSFIAVIAGATTAIWLAFSDAYILSLLPRIVTIPIAVNLSESIGGLPTLTVLFSMTTCFVGVFIGPHILKHFSIKNPLSIGMVYGLGAQALGTAKAFEMGDKQGTTSSVSYILTAIFTVIWALLLTPVLKLFM
ncbi:MAG TPA: LrgB family protein [Pseudogracilibacillus sp.]|nr:LrgB family protein [Pseudogracilibacillus sp.]